MKFAIIPALLAKKILKKENKQLYQLVEEHKYNKEVLLNSGAKLFFLNNNKYVISGYAEDGSDVDVYLKKTAEYIGVKVIERMK